MSKLRVLLADKYPSIFEKVGYLLDRTDQKFAAELETRKGDRSTSRPLNIWIQTYSKDCLPFLTKRSRLADRGSP
jgi:hypothetical protein